MKLIIISGVFAIFLITFSSAFESNKGKGNCFQNYDLNHTMPCSQIYNIFNKCTGKFIEVALNTSDPFKLCTDKHAYKSHRNLKLFFNLLSTSQDHNTTCSDIYMNKNSMGIVSKINSFANSLWDNAFCDDCYVNTTAISQNYSDYANQIFKLKQEYTNCTKNYNNNQSVICTECEDIYTQMNIIFNHHKEKFGNICFDIEDIVNKTRIEWSTKFKCCKDKKDSLTAFYSLFSTILTLAVFFYGSVYCFGSRNSIVETIDANHIVNNSTTTVSDRNAPSSSQSSSSSSNVKPKESINP
ncbi:hypothetical protein PVAND_005458 [Polypedilum vanderplanki]|uniref:Osteopetrosis-associated transmembrane protein 1 n=1 Tax=Polypedilum vanderplanki TaxID=319348 RepID=A0A9J6C170_POLVA|nr:hypothetical protein PVAND_005458 [Polypedilum vanderplanki]